MNIISKTSDEVKQFQKLILTSIALNERSTFLILSNDPILDIENLRNYLIENKLRKFAKKEIFRLLERIDVFLMYKTRYEQLPVSEIGFSYYYPSKGKGFGDGSLTYVQQVSNGFLKIRKERFDEIEPLYSRFTLFNYFRIESKLLEIKELFTEFANPHQQPEPEAIDLSDTTAVEKIIYLQKLGVIDFLRTKQPFNTSINSLATVLSAITGEKTITVQPMLNPILSKDAVQKNNPLNSKKTVQKVEKQLIHIGFNLDETI